MARNSKKLVVSADVSPVVSADVSPVVSADVSPVVSAQWLTVNKKGLQTKHTRETVRGLFYAPPKVRGAILHSADTNQLKNGNFAAIRDGLHLIKGKELQVLQASIVAACSIVADGVPMAPIIQWGNIRAKTHALAVARYVAKIEGLKGRKLAFQAVCNDWVTAEDAPKPE